MKYEVTVNRAHIDSKVGLPVRVTETNDPDAWADYAAIRIIGDSIVRHGPQRRNGATVWIECDNFVAVSP